MKLLAPTETFLSLKEELEISALIMEKPSEIRVPLPISHRKGVSCFCSTPKLEPVWSFSDILYPIARR